MAGLASLTLLCAGGQICLAPFAAIPRKELTLLWEAGVMHKFTSLLENASGRSNFF